MPFSSNSRTKTTGPSETRLCSSAAELALHPAVLSFLAPDAGNPSPSSATLTRYLRARNNDPEAAARMLQATLLLPPCSSPCVHCVHNFRAHSFYPIGPSDSGEPVAYSNFAAENTDPDANVEHMRFAMDNLMRNDSLERMIWVMDMRFFGKRHLSPAVARKVLGLFADHYPERLKRAIIYDAPLIFSSLWSAVKIFADPVTVQKVSFVRHNVNDRADLFRSHGITGGVLDKLLKEIDEARDNEIFATKNWWTCSPIPPLRDIGEMILNEAALEES